MSSRRHAKGTPGKRPQSQRLPKRTSTLARWAAPPVIIASIVMAFGACGNGAPHGTVTLDSIPECDAYEAAYRSCTAHLGARAELATDRHASTLRTDVALAAADPTQREKQRQSCIAGTSHLARACR